MRVFLQHYEHFTYEPYPMRVFLQHYEHFTYEPYPIRAFPLRTIAVTNLIPCRTLFYAGIRTFAYESLLEYLIPSYEPCV